MCSSIDREHTDHMDCKKHALTAVASHTARIVEGPSLVEGEAIRRLGKAGKLVRVWQVTGWR